MSYEVVLAALNYLLILHKDLEIENKFQKHLSLLPNDNILDILRENKDYLSILCDILRGNEYLECTEKALKVLTLEKGTQKYIVQVKTNKEELTDESIIRELFNLINNEHENLTHIYLKSLSSFVSDEFEDLQGNKSIVLEVIRVMFACSSSENDEETRSVVVGFLERNFERLLKMELEGLNKENQCKYFFD